MKNTRTLTCVLLFPVILLTTLSRRQPGTQQNQTPVVKIVNPLSGAAISAGIPVSYEVTVADKEDGNSKYDEINGKEVLLKVHYVADRVKAQNLLKVLPATPAGLDVIQASNCFNCHNYNTRAMGPSFAEISKKYPPTHSNTDSLIKTVMQGSSGVWGKDKMPAHPELTPAAVKNAIEWILKHGNEQGVVYLAGLQGQFRPDQLMPAGKRGGALVLTATYIDHGEKNNPSATHLKGTDAMVLIIN